MQDSVLWLLKDLNVPVALTTCNTHFYVRPGYVHTPRLALMFVHTSHRAVTVMASRTLQQELLCIQLHRNALCLHGEPQSLVKGLDWCPR